MKLAPIMTGDSADDVITFAGAVNNLICFAYNSFVGGRDKENRRLSDHTHDCVEIFVILDGEQDYFIEGRACHLSGGDVVVTYPNEVHGLHGQYWRAKKLLWMQIDTSDTGGFLSLSGALADNLRQAMTRGDVRQWRPDAETFQSVIAAYIDFKAWSKGDASLNSGYALLLNFLTKLFCRHTDKARILSPCIQDALDYMGSRASYATGIPEIAAHVHLSEAYFKSKFKRELGVTPRRYLIDKIMEKAKRDLSSTDRSVTEIAFDYGFSSSSYFSSVFRQETGLTPRAYRSLCGRSGIRA